MTNKVIQLSKTLVLSSVDEASEYGIQRAYESYISEYNYKLDFLRVGQGRLLFKEKHQEIEKSLETTFFSLFINDQSTGFNNNQGHELDIVGVSLKINRVPRGSNDLRLFVKFISKPYTLIDTILDTLFIHDTSIAQDFVVFPIKLDNTTSIYSIAHND